MRRHFRHFVAVLMYGLCAASTSVAQSTPPRITAAGEHLQPGDVVRLRVWREPDLTGEYQVDEGGQATFPKLGAIRVASIAPDSLQALLIARYSQYLRDPSIEVVLLRRIHVLGAVRNPGLYTVDPTMRVADAIALAGGPTPNGRDDEVRLHREGTTTATSVTESSRLADLALRSGDQLHVPERSWLRRNSVALLTSAITAGGILLGTLLAR